MSFSIARLALAAVAAGSLPLALSACGKVATVPIYVVLPERNVAGVPWVLDGVDSLRISVRGGTPGGADMVTFAQHEQAFDPSGPVTLSIDGLTGGRGRYVVLEALVHSSAGAPGVVVARGASSPRDYLAPGQAEPTGKKYPGATLFLGRIGAFEPVRTTLADGRAFAAPLDIGGGRFALVGGVGRDAISGATIALASVELFDPNAFGFVRAPADLAVPRAWAAAAAIPGGGGVVSGGLSIPAAGGAAEASAEFLDANGTPTGQSIAAIPRVLGVASTVKQDGVERVLFAGGSPTLDISSPDSTLQELAGTTLGNTLLSLNAKRSGFTATELADGRVLFAGGYARVSVFGGTETVGATASAETLDTSAPPYHFDTADMFSRRWGHSAVRLDDGTVLLVGGAQADPDASGTAPATRGSDLFIPAGSTFATPIPLASESYSAANPALVKLSTGNVLIAGGSSIAGAWVVGTASAPSLGCAATYHPSEGRFVKSGSLIIPRMGATPLALPGGQVMLVGGHGPDARPQATAELYTPCWPGDDCPDAGEPPVDCPETAFHSAVMPSARGAW